MYVRGVGERALGKNTRRNLFETNVSLALSPIKHLSAGPFFPAEKFCNPRYIAPGKTGEGGLLTFACARFFFSGCVIGKVGYAKEVMKEGG